MPQTEYFQLDQEQLEFVLNSCTSWMRGVQELIVEPHIPEGVQLDQSAVKAQPMHGFPEPGESMREFIERPARERQESLRAEAERKAEAEKRHREWLEESGIKPPETKEEREQREREEYQAWIKAVEDSLKPPE